MKYTMGTEVCAQRFTETSGEGGGSGIDRQHDDAHN
jgi:hypothetical protein